MPEPLESELPYLKTLAMRFHSECAAAGMGTDDLAQETLIRALSSASLPGRESERRRYLHRIMANLMCDHLDAARALIGSRNQRIHLLTTRHQASEFERVPPAEIIQKADGSMTLTGIDPVRSAHLHNSHELEP